MLIIYYLIISTFPSSGLVAVPQPGLDACVQAAMRINEHRVNERAFCVRGAAPQAPVVEHIQEH